MQAVISASAINAAFSRLIRADGRLRNSIACYKILADEVLINATDPGAVGAKRYRIIRLLWLCGHPVRTIRINDEVIDVQQQLQIEPRVVEKADGPYDKKLIMNLLEQDSLLLKASLSFIATKATVFIISTDGVYKRVLIRDGTQSKIHPDQMLGRSLREVLREENRETADYVLEQIREAYKQGQSRTIRYGLWDRTYESSIWPSPGANQVILVCERLS